MADGGQLYIGKAPMTMSAAELIKTCYSFSDKPSSSLLLCESHLSYSCMKYLYLLWHKSSWINFPFDHIWLFTILYHNLGMEKDFGRFHLGLPDFQMSCRDISTWECARIEASTMAVGWHPLPQTQYVWKMTFHIHVFLCLNHQFSVGSCIDLVQDMKDFILEILSSSTADLYFISGMKFSAICMMQQEFRI